MNIEESIEELKLFIKSIRSDLEEEAEDNFRIAQAIETLLTAYEKEKEISHYIQSQLDIANAKLVEEKEKNSKLLEALDTVNHEKGVFIESYEKEKEKNKKIDEFCRKELAFERRLERENRKPDEFNQGRFYVSENIRKIIKEE